LLLGFCGKKIADKVCIYWSLQTKGGIMPGKFELKKGKSGKFSFNLKAANGQVILTSQSYKTKAAAKNGIKSVCENCGKKSSFEQKTSKKGEPYFVMLAANQQVIGKSQMYASKTSMMNGIKSVKTNATKASIKDLSV
jgi:uncharacterized protein YegP (UPF0339 family)